MGCNNNGNGVYTGDMNNRYPDNNSYNRFNNSQHKIFDHQEYIKYTGDLIAVNGSNVVERIYLNDLNIPYRQILKGRIILKKGQSNYLFNFLGLGDNATFLSIISTYNIKSVDEEDNYVQYNYFTDLTHTYSFKEILLLTGNSTNRIPQLYLTNPNPLYPVTLDVMIAVIDNQSEFFVTPVDETPIIYFNSNFGNDGYITLNGLTNSLPYNSSQGLTFSSYTYLWNYVNNTITYNDVVHNAINSIFDGISATMSLTSLLLNGSSYVDITNSGTYSLVFDATNTEFVDVLLNLSVIDNPIIYFNPTFGLSGSYISLNGLTSSNGFNSSQGLTFSAFTSLSYYNGNINYNNIINDLIYNIFDNIILSSDNIIINGLSYSGITSSGTYSITFNGFTIDPLLNLNLIIN